MESAELEFEVDEVDVQAFEKFLHDVVDAKSHVLDGVDLFLRGKIQRQRMIVVEQRVAEVIVLIAELEHRRRQLGALRHAVALGKAARGGIADDDFQRHDLHLFDRRFAIGELFHEMRGDAVLLHDAEHHVAHLVVDDALAADRALFQGR